MKQWWVVPGPDGGVSELREVDAPEPGPDQVVVDVVAAAINRGELIGRPAMRLDTPNVRARPSGIEFAGTVSSIGSAVQSWSVGDRVMGRGSACHADAVAVDAAALMAVPDGLDLVEAGAIPNVFVTAHDAMVTTADLQAGESVLVTAGSSGVGTAAIQIARVMGAGPIVATTRAAQKADTLRALGATDVVNTSEDDWARDVREITGGVDVVIDQVGGALMPGCLETMAVGGRCVTVGRNAGKRAEVDLDLIARQRLSLIGVTFRTRTKAEALACSERFAEHLLSAFDDGALRPVLDRTFPLEALPEAHEYMQSDAQVGKIALVP